MQNPVYLKVLMTFRGFGAERTELAKFHAQTPELAALVFF